MTTVLYPSDCLDFWDALNNSTQARPSRSFGFVVVLIGIGWITRGFKLLMGGSFSNDDDEQERMNRRNDETRSCIPQSLILNDRIKREERRRSSTRIGSDT